LDESKLQHCILLLILAVRAQSLLPWWAEAISGGGDNVPITDIPTYLCRVYSSHDHKLGHEL